MLTLRGPGPPLIQATLKLPARPHVDAAAAAAPPLRTKRLDKMTLATCAAAPGVLAVLGARVARRRRSVRARAAGAVKERPLVDQLVTSAVKVLEAAELSRVNAASEVPSAANGGWSGEPREWADSTSLTQRISKVSQFGPLAQLKQLIADTLAGDYDRAEVQGLIQRRIQENRVMMFSFSTCPFCLRAKQLLRTEYGIEPAIYECDLEPEGSAVRAELGRMTGRTSMPSTWLGSDVLLGGCNDGGLGGVATLHEEGRLEGLLSGRGEMGLPFELPSWLPFQTPSMGEVARRKRRLKEVCAQAPPNGVGAPEELKRQVEGAAGELESCCPEQPARQELTGTWDLLYCTAPGGSNGKVGPFVGKVSQTFLDEERFRNEVELFGLVKVSLEAERRVVDDDRIRVVFREMAFSVLGFEVFRKEAKGSGVWQQRFVDGDLRVMSTPSLFVLQRRMT